MACELCEDEEVKDHELYWEVSSLPEWDIEQLSHTTLAYIGIQIANLLD